MLSIDVEYLTGATFAFRRDALETFEAVTSLPPKVTLTECLLTALSPSRLLDPWESCCTSQVFAIYRYRYLIPLEGSSAPTYRFHIILMIETHGQDSRQQRNFPPIVRI